MDLRGGESGDNEELHVCGVVRKLMLCWSLVVALVLEAVVNAVDADELASLLEGVY